MVVFSPVTPRQSSISNRRCRFLRDDKTFLGVFFHPIAGDASKKKIFAIKTLKQ